MKLPLKTFLIPAIVLVPSLASANSAMGLGLERWDLRFWYAYVAVIVLAEAWLLGRWLGFNWKQSLFRSIVANLFTGVICGGIGLLAPFLHTPMAGSRINPNPLADMLLTIAAFSLPSAIFESAFWTKEGKVRLFKLCAVHFATIPLALVILLMPDRPYPGLEGFTRARRSVNVWQIEKELQEFIQNNDALPKSASIPELHKEIGSKVELACFYLPTFERFETTEKYTRPFLINASLLGKSIPATDKDEEWVWFIKPPDRSNRFTIKINLANGETRSRR